MRRVGASLLLAGGAACAYHATEPSGKRVRLRSALRKLDHWTVSLASAALVQAASPEVCNCTCSSFRSGCAEFSLQVCQPCAC